MDKPDSDETGETFKPFDLLDIKNIRHRNNIEYRHHRILERENPYKIGKLIRNLDKVFIISNPNMRLS